MKMSWFFIIFFLCFTISNLEATPDQKKLPSTVVVGTVYCDTCFQENFSKSSHFISGASVAVECRDGTSKPSFRQQVKTDEHGEFKIPLPFSVSKHVKKIKRCAVKLIKSSEPNCAVASTATSSSLHLKSRKEGTHIFSAGFFTFKPLHQPNLCNQKPSLENSKALDDPSFPPPIQDPTTPDLPGIPLLPKLPPLPQLPPLPPLPGLPYLPPMPGKTLQTKPEQLSRLTQLSDQKVSHPHSFFPTTPLPPNPLLPPPIFPPNPLQPPSPLIPLPPVPGLTPSPLIPLPPVPGLTPSPLIPLPPVPGLTPSPTPTFPFPPLPPFPFPPLPPRIPGIPPAPSSP
ncbi:hypothetical protein Dsin_016978 [Dipteronia sinensis]|uniref:Pollen Ole e 1 allergen and extensin family protein n=1 Tax=Dipteronia sinensis TaxID=43782 RepID=A0AAE0E694_9ROSI|nr:hypothetical protein Dsin_016978 [Dipteronia sinensis]